MYCLKTGLYWISLTQCVHILNPYKEYWISVRRKDTNPKRSNIFALAMANGDEIFCKTEHELRRLAAAHFCTIQYEIIDHTLGSLVWLREWVIHAYKMLINWTVSDHRNNTLWTLIEGDFFIPQLVIIGLFHTASHYGPSNNYLLNFPCKNKSIIEN